MSSTEALCNIKSKIVESVSSYAKREFEKRTQEVRKIRIQRNAFLYFSMCLVYPLISKCSKAPVWFSAPLTSALSYPGSSNVPQRLSENSAHTSTDPSYKPLPYLPLASCPAKCTPAITTYIPKYHGPKTFYTMNANLFPPATLPLKLYKSNHNLGDYLVTCVCIYLFIYSA